jgi:hypothetical protein
MNKAKMDLGLCVRKKKRKMAGLGALAHFFSLPAAHGNMMQSFIDMWPFIAE